MKYRNDIIQSRQSVFTIFLSYTQSGPARIKNIFLYGPIENKRILGNHTHVVHDIPLGELGNVLIPNLDFPAGMLVELADTCRQGTFTAA